MSRNRCALKSTSCSRRVLGYAPLAVAIMLSFARPTQAANIAVNSTDAVSEAGVCTIIDAVTAVNTQAAVNGCAAGDGDNDTIDLTGFTTPTTISLTQAVPTTGRALIISNNVNIVGLLNGQTPLVTIQRSTVSGTPAFGLINSTAPLNIIGLTLSNGASGMYSGGAILASSNLTMSYCVVSNNTSDSAGGGIAASAQFAIDHSIVTGNTGGNAGGGIETSSSTSIYFSTVSNNATLSATSSSTGGGGVFTNGSLLMRNTTVDGNTSASGGGGIYGPGVVNIVNSTISNNVASNGSGGGVFGGSGGVSIDSSTITANHAEGDGGGIYGGPVALTNSTITGNSATGIGAGVAADVFMSSYATITLNTSAGPGGGVNFVTSAKSYGTIFSGNNDGTTADDLATAGTAALMGQYNIVSATTVTTPSGTRSCVPTLLPLADNGGPTQTMALQTGDTCAIDYASSSPAQTTDQRGFPRPAVVGSNADIGAYEFGSMDPDKIFANGFET
jgi:predicted outer membrane repeat protein